MQVNSKLCRPELFSGFHLWMAGSDTCGFWDLKHHFQLGGCKTELLNNGPSMNQTLKRKVECISKGPHAHVFILVLL